MTLLDALAWVMYDNTAPLEFRLEAASVLLPYMAGDPAENAAGAGPVMRGLPRRH
jgi:hypothetical protein